MSIRQERESLRCTSSSGALGSEFVRRYFRLDEDFERILTTFSLDKIISRAAQKFYGLRLIRQDGWECLASFLLATNANIPRIKKMVSSISERYGKAFEFEGEVGHEFPTPGALATASVADLTGCGLGYRAAFLKHVAKAVDHGKVDFGRLATLEYPEARRQLLAKLLGKKVLLGVGPKVADCVLLYSLGKDQAFPIDVWIARELARSYPRLFARGLRRKLFLGQRARLTPRDYDRVSESARKYFGNYAGYAQQYLYMAARSAG